MIERGIPVSPRFRRGCSNWAGLTAATYGSTSGRRQCRRCSQIRGGIGRTRAPAGRGTGLRKCYPIRYPLSEIWLCLAEFADAPMMHGREKSDLVIVAMKPANKAVSTAAEPVERRAEAKGNASQQSTCRTQSRVRVSQALERIRQ